MRHRRNNLTAANRQSAANAIARRIGRLLLKPCQHIAVYDAIDGEVSLQAFARDAERRSCRIYAPRITNMRQRTMNFVATSGRTNFKPSKQEHRAINPRKLDIVLVPLVAFDDTGGRLGFGAGFYDRKFAFKRRRFKRTPRLIGIGYDFQRIARQTPSPWDVPLDLVVTERAIYRCRKI
jgi:5-formyltetrahydrofolate cyclo-ligase